MKKVKIFLDYVDENNINRLESVWAIPYGENYKILNIPFLSKNIAFGDVVRVVEVDGLKKVDRLITASGNSTIQIIFFDPQENLITSNELSKMGCGWEGSHLDKLISVNVPKEVSYKKVKNYLDLKEKADLLSYREACIA
ncbi:MAG TPA: DUF4265 domain-containing protein [Bacteroidia bacterium]|nr:DUF4265 domain-containing protein [Bacteroidia bacterium]